MGTERNGTTGRATVHHWVVDLADSERKLWRKLELRTARQELETDEEFATRLLAFALSYSPGLTMNEGPRRGNEPVMSEQDPMSGRWLLWVDVGRPDHERLRHALSRANEVVLYPAPADETVLALVRTKHFAGRATPRIFLLPREVVRGAADHLERRMEWYLSREGDDLLLAHRGGTYEGTLVEVHFAGRSAGHG